MTVSSPSPSLPSLTGGLSRARSPEEAAAQFEEILTRQFVKTMTKDLFQSNLAGDDGPAWVDSNQDTQRDLMTDILTQHLTAQGTLGIKEMMLRQWRQTGYADGYADGPADPPPTPEAPAPADRLPAAAPRLLPTDERLP